MSTLIRQRPSCLSGQALFAVRAYRPIVQPMEIHAGYCGGLGGDFVRHSSKGEKIGRMIVVEE